MARKNSLLWTISGEALPATSYLFGTMHVKDHRAFRYEALVKAAISQCAAFATEFSIDEMLAQPQSQAMFLPADQSLDQLLSEKKYNKLKKVIQKRTGLDVSMFNHTKPLLLINLLSEQLLSADRGVALDQYLWQFARQEGKLLLGIETYEEQLLILEKISIRHQLKALMEIVKNFKRFRKQLLKMTCMYEQGDLQRLHQAARNSIGGMRKVLLHDRNYLMANRIYRLASEQSLCAAIGAGHLGGGKGVLRLLKKKGLTVKAVPFVPSPPQ